MELLTLSLFGAFFLALLEHRLELGIFKAFISLGLTSLGEVILWSGDINQKIVTAVAAAFLSIVLLELAQLLADY